jgi:hypothetical protein
LKNGVPVWVARLVKGCCGGAFLVLSVFAGCAFAVTINHAGEKPATTPAGAVNKVCNGCHSTEVVMSTPKDYNDWHDTVQRMIDRGAIGTPAEFDLVMQFLYENMTTIDVNHSDTDALRVVLNAPDSAVSAIIARRSKRPFKNLADLESIRGLNGPALDAKKRMIFFN